MDEEMNVWLLKWQTLLGAALGGLIGLLSALIVAHSQRRREEVSAAMILAGNLVKVIYAYHILLKQFEDKRIPVEDRHLFISEQLAIFRPTFSPMFDASVARVMPVNGKLACHLELFRSIYSDVEAILQRIANDYEIFKQTGTHPRTKDEMKFDSKRVATGFDTVVQHAICAEHLLSKLILSQTPTLNRLRILIWRTRKERNCSELLMNGVPNQAMQLDFLNTSRSG
jgi:hypothetical protein